MEANTVSPERRSIREDRPEICGVAGTVRSPD